MIVTIDYRYTDENGEEHSLYVNTELQKDGKTGVVYNKNFEYAGLNNGDILEINTEDIYIFAIIENNESYFADQLYVLM